MGVQRVELLARMTGDYAAFHESNMYALYDFTNHKHLGEFTCGSQFKDEWFTDEYREDIKEEFIPEVEKIARSLANERQDWGDIDIIDAYLIDGNYYYKIDE
jgi:hypothetical protein